jgi:hypothetical protein
VPSPGGPMWSIMRIAAPLTRTKELAGGVPVGRIGVCQRGNGLEHCLGIAQRVWTRAS